MIFGRDSASGTERSLSSTQRDTFSLALHGTRRFIASLSATVRSACSFGRFMEANIFVCFARGAPTRLRRLPTQGSAVRSLQGTQGSVRSAIRGRVEAGSGRLHLIRKGETMASDRTVYHVVPNVDQSKWLVTRENDRGFREEYETKASAEEAAKVRAREEEPSQVKVHLKNGNMDYESTYGDDPPETPS